MRSRSDSLRALLLGRGDLVVLRGERELSLPVVAPPAPRRRFFSLRSESLDDEDDELEESLELLELEREFEPELLLDDELPDELCMVNVYTTI